MTGFKIGDKVRGLGVNTTAEVLGTWEDKLWIRPDGEGYPYTTVAADWEVIPEFFEAGKTYRFENTGRVFAVKRVDANSDGSLVAYGVVTHSVTDVARWGTRHPADWAPGAWKEVQEGW